MPQLLARSSLSLSVDLQLQSEQLYQERSVTLDPPSSHLQHRVRGLGQWDAACPRQSCRSTESMLSTEPLSHPQIPLLLERRPKELLSNLKGFFPATVQPYTVRHTHSPEASPSRGHPAWVPHLPSAANFCVQI